MKPIPTLTRGLPTFDLCTGKETSARYERSDVCAVPAASVVGEAMAILAVAGAILSGFAQPSMTALAQAFAGQRRFWEGL
jgi:chorismate synthase